MRLLHAVLITGLGAAPATAQERVTVPGDPDARLPEAVRESLARIDPALDGWGTEGLASVAGERLTELVEEVVLGGATTAPEWVHEGVASGRLRSAERVTAERGVFRVQEAAIEAASDRGSQALLDHLAGLAGALDGCPERRAKVKVDGVEAREDGLEFRTAVRVELFGRGPDGVAQVTTRWSCRWVDEGDGPRLTRLARLAYEEVRRDGAPLFADVTEAVLGGEVFDQQLRPGLGYWRERLDASLGIGSLGHAGVALGDVDGDGLEDLYLGQPGGLPNRLFLHREDGTTVEGAREAGVDLLAATTGALLVDLDGDRDPDLAVTADDELVLFENEGGRFTARARHPVGGATSLAAADADGDGSLDLYVCGYLSPYDGLTTPLPYHDAENGQPNVLLANRGGFAFEDATAALGLDANNRRFSFAAAWEDYDDDGDPDLYVANDFGRNNLYRNDGGRFVDVAAELGVQDLSAGMGVAWADVDGDGDMDLHVANMFSAAGGRVAFQRRFQPGAAPAERAGLQRHARGNSLFLNHGEDGFEDVSESAGIGMGRWAWGARFLELDNDGRPDLYVPNGFVTNERADDL